jgi:hypothetical protein
MYGNHQKLTATKCGHGIHPSAAAHTPNCPRCVVADSKSKTYAAAELLCLHGGISPLEHRRTQSWNVARLRYDIVRQRLRETREREIRRRERERAWDVAHRRGGLRHVQAGAKWRDCAVCASMVPSASIEVPQVQTEKDLPWWERPGGLACDHILVPRTPMALRSPSSSPMRDYQDRGPSVLRAFIQQMRSEMSMLGELRQKWEARNRLESAVRRKHGLDQSYPFNPDFWDNPLPEFVCRRNYMNTAEHRRALARRARGNQLRPKPPRSSLSLSEVVEEVQMDENQLEEMRRTEEAAEFGRLMRRVSKEVGYLYLIGSMDCMEEWNDDYLDSDKQLVWRDPEKPADDEEDDKEDEGKDEGSSGEDYDEMELD